MTAAVSIDTWHRTFVFAALIKTYIKFKEMTVFTLFKVHSFEHNYACIMYSTCVLCYEPFDQAKTYTVFDLANLFLRGLYRGIVVILMRKLFHIFLYAQNIWNIYESSNSVLNSATFMEKISRTNFVRFPVFLLNIQFSVFS